MSQEDKYQKLLKRFQQQPETTPEEVESAVSHIAGAVSTEASGNITPQNIVSYAETGVDFLSLGFLTHSAPIVDMSLLKV